MKNLICILICGGLLSVTLPAFAATARCQVVKKEGNVLIMDCGDRADGFKEKSQVKIKTDRDK